MQQIDQQIANLESLLNMVHDAKWQDRQFKYKMSVEYGKVYARIVKGEIWNNNPDEEVNRSVYGFIKLDDLTLWKAAGWKAPAKNKARGKLEDLQILSLLRNQWFYSIN